MGTDLMLHKDRVQDVNPQVENATWEEVKNGTIVPIFKRTADHLKSLGRSPKFQQITAPAAPIALYWQGNGTLRSYTVGFQVKCDQKGVVQFTLGAIRIDGHKLQLAALRQTTCFLHDSATVTMIHKLADDSLGYFLNMENRNLPTVTWKTTMDLPERWN